MLENDTYQWLLLVACILDSWRGREDRLLGKESNRDYKPG